MKHLNYLLMALFLLIGVSESSAQQRKIGVGLIIGEPTGISLNLWRTPVKAIAFGLGWSAFQHQTDTQTTRIHLHMDFLRHSFNTIRTQEQISVYYGVGGRFVGGTGISSSLAVRGVLGIDWLPQWTPLDLFVEVAPSLDVVPATNFNLDAALGIRYYF
ncbi:MAG: hypothetical protein K9N34_10520 [Candidatus Marinimicrobia bacterium]|nr:hypothetical protein [Candidatus Neomarinimicrobiota bacterium]